MAKDHSHPEPVKCAHDLGWCAKCERPYCKACGKEWYEQTFTWTDTFTTAKWPKYVPPTYPTYPGITWTTEPNSGTNVLPLNAPVNLPFIQCAHGGE